MKALRFGSDELDRWRTINVPELRIALGARERDQRRDCRRVA